MSAQSRRVEVGDKFDSRPVIPLSFLGITPTFRRSVVGAPAADIPRMILSNGALSPPSISHEQRKRGAVKCGIAPAIFKAHSDPLKLLKNSQKEAGNRPFSGMISEAHVL